MNRNGQPSKAAAIRSILKAAGKPILFADLHQAVEKRLQQVVGRQRLKTYLSVMQTNNGDIRGTGRGDTRRYEFVEGGK